MDWLETYKRKLSIIERIQRLKSFRFKITLHEGEELPSYYGFAYHDYLRNYDVCYPVFINHIVRLYRTCRYWLKAPAKDNGPSYIEVLTALQGLSDAYDIGQEAGQGSAIYKARNVLHAFRVKKSLR